MRLCDTTVCHPRTHQILELIFSQLILSRDISESQTVNLKEKGNNNCVVLLATE